MLVLLLGTLSVVTFILSFNKISSFSSSKQYLLLSLISNFYVNFILFLPSSPLLTSFSQHSIIILFIMILLKFLLLDSQLWLYLLYGVCPQLVHSAFMIVLFSVYLHTLLFPWFWACHSYIPSVLILYSCMSWC